MSRGGKRKRLSPRTALEFIPEMSDDEYAT